MHESVKEYSLERRVDAYLAEIARTLTGKRGELTKLRDQLTAVEREVTAAEKKIADLANFAGVGQLPPPFPRPLFSIYAERP